MAVDLGAASTWCPTQATPASFTTLRATVSAALRSCARFFLAIFLAGCVAKTRRIFLPKTHPKTQPKTHRIFLAIFLEIFLPKTQKIFLAIFLGRIKKIFLGIFLAKTHPIFLRIFLRIFLAMIVAIFLRRFLAGSQRG